MQKYVKGCLKDLITPQPYEYKRQVYDNNIFCFDIETTSGWINNDLQIIPFNKRIPKDEYKKYIPLSLVYIWQFSINDTVLYGRYLEDFKYLVDELEEIVECPTIWVHNLSYEFQFLLNIFKFDKVFARKAHKVIYADYNSVRFRCSYFLTRLSLANWAKETGKIEKLVGNLDYNVIRTPKTPMTQKELDYCVNDVLAMYFGLLKYREKYGNIEHIPLTQTGEVRRVVKEIYKNNYGWHQKMTKLLPKDAEEYAFLKAAFQGGYTHANYIHAGKIVYDVKSKDISSSYPTVMLCEKFPMSPWVFTRPFEIDKYRNDDYSLLLDVTLYDIKPKKSMTYISTSKCYDYDKKVVNKKLKPAWKTDNGRLLSCKWVSMKITNIDLDIIEQCYDIGKIKFNKILRSKNDYLPREFIAFILELYANKTSYKDVIGKEAIYLAAKQMLNSLYGMMVTDIVPSDYDYDSDKGWTKASPTITDALDELHNKPYKNFTAYQHGVWITAYARRNLWKIILQMSDDVVYVDTDSVKYIGEHEELFNKYNEEIVNKLKLSMSKFEFRFEATHPKTPKGKEKQIGIYDTERPYYKFITLGAKRYAFQHEIDSDIEITVSGVNPKVGATQLMNLCEFNEKLIFDTDHTKKLLFTYCSDMPPVIWQDGKEDEYISHYKYGINSQPTTYGMSLNDEYRNLLMYALQNYLGVSTLKYKR